MKLELLFVLFEDVVGDFVRLCNNFLLLLLDFNNLSVLDSPCKKLSNLSKVCLVIFHLLLIWDCLTSGILLVKEDNFFEIHFLGMCYHFMDMCLSDINIKGKGMTIFHSVKLFV